MNQEPQKTQQELDAEMLQEYQSQQQNPTYVSSPQPEPATPTLANNDAITLLILGIVAVALFDIFPLAGIIVGLIGMKKAKVFTDQGIELSGKAKIGALLCKIGLIVCAVTTVIFAVILTFYFGTLILAIMSEMIFNY
ncbi:MAG: hypothetical protein IJP35_00180 [Clostridia bacterium]|nr:hypothetical protein [Clostridia bacterium]